MTRRVRMVIVLLVATVAALPASVALAQQEATLEGRAVLPADTFADGPPSGADLEEETKGGRTPPFEGQPVGGISAVLDEGDGGYLAMADNGFGKKDNSSDFLLRAYRISPDFETANGGSGEIPVGEEFVQLRDPDGHIPFEITNEDSEDRLLTGGDFDIESVRRDARGSLWFGDEFGPFLLHTDATGRVLEAPIPLPDVKSPENPTLGAEEEPNLPTSKGFEGMAISEDGSTLYPMLEGALEDQEGSERFIYEFSLASESYTSERWRYRTEDPEYSIGDLTALGGGRFLVIERDNEQGEEAGFKKVYEVDLNREDSEGYLVKEEVLDLLSIRDPNLISLPPRDEGDIGLGDPFSFPFQTIESILPLGDGRLLLLNDNNYPLSAGRNPDQPDDTEAIIVRTDALSPPPTEMPGTGGPPLLVLVGPVLVAIIVAVWMLLQRRVIAVAVRRSP